MLILNRTPTAEDDLAALYQRMSTEGMVQSSIMCGEQYHQSENFDDDWACPALTWSAGGSETYTLNDGRVYDFHHSGAMTIAAGARYSYAAGATSFFSNMIVFPHFIANVINADDTILKTRLIRPDRETESLMAAIAAHCRESDPARDNGWYHDKLAILYKILIATQREIDRAPQNMNVAKQKTQIELAARADRAQQYILKNLHDSSLTITMISREACLSPYHLIRVFKALTRHTPMQYLKAARMTAASRLLRDTDFTISDIAAFVGYSDRTAFWRAFQKKFGAAPSAYRSALQ